MPTDFIRYDLLVQDALRSVVRKVLTDAARTGLPGEHHFNISFKTQGPGVNIPAQMRQRYPDEMAIILQHEFWDLTVGADAFEVSLNFSRKPERLTIPFDSITGFSDPSVPFGFKLEPRLTSERESAAPTPATGPREVPKPVRALASAPTKPLPAPAKPLPAPVASKLAPAEKSSDKVADKAAIKPPAKPSEAAAKIVSIDAFRKK
jgi:hypothetical protein